MHRYLGKYLDAVERLVEKRYQRSAQVDPITDSATTSGNRATGSSKEGGRFKSRPEMPSMKLSTPNGRYEQRGFTYMSLLFFIAILGVGLAATAVSWQTARQRDKERELLFVGIEFRDAIALYYNRSPGAVKEFPRDLNDLIKDPRYPTVQRYLRRIYRDPMTGQAQWGTVTALGGGIMGVYSLSKEMPIKKAGFTEAQKAFNGASAYSDWKFVYELPPNVVGAGIPNIGFPSSDRPAK